MPVLADPPPPPIGIAWVHQFGTSDKDFAYSVAVDSSGNMYVAGSTGLALPGQSSAGGYDPFIRKYSRSGDILWTRQFGASEADHARAVAVDGAGGVYVTGFTRGSFTMLGNAGGWDAFVRKYTGTGAELWTRQFGSTADDFAHGVAADASVVYVVGETGGSLPGFTSSGSSDAFIRQYDTVGNLKFTDQFGTNATEAGFAVDIGGTGVYVAGATFGTFSECTSSGGWDVFVRKYKRVASDGSFFWTRQFGTSADDYGYGVASDGVNIFVAGHTFGAFPGFPSDRADDAFVRKIDGTGAPLWTRQFGTNSSDIARSVAVDAAGNAYVVGDTYGSLLGFTNLGDYDAFVRSFNGSGDHRWTRQFGTSGGDFAYDVAPDGDGNTYVVGVTQGELPYQTNAGFIDAYVARFSPIVPASVNVDPDVINLKAKGNWVTAYIELPPGYDLADIELSTVRLHRVPAVTDPRYDFVSDPAVYLTDVDGDGVLERMVKFDVDKVRVGLEPGDEVEILARGELAQVYFKATDTIRVIGN